MAKLPLEGIRVIDMTVVFAGPFGAMMLADLGAEVIAIESIQHVHLNRLGVIVTPFGPMRFPEAFGEAPHSREQPAPMITMMITDRNVGGHRPWDRTAIWNRHARNKMSCCINLGDPMGVEVLHRLIKVSDILMENNSAGLMDKMGVGYSVARELNPNIIYIQCPGWGMTGPYRDNVAYGDCVEATTGHTWLRGYPDEGHPMHNVAVYHMDATAGGTMALAAVMGVYRRNKTGKGQYIDISGAETSMVQFPQAFMDYTMNGRDQRTIGNRDPEAAPSGCYPCRGEDRWVTITIQNDEQWKGFCQAIDSPTWAMDKRFATYEGRRENHDELDGLISEWTSHHDNYEVMFILQRYGIPSAPVLDPRDAIHDPQLLARGFYETISHREAGTHMYPGFLWKFSKTPLSIRKPPCCLGEHNDYVFKEVASMSDDEYWDLAEQEIIGGDVYVGDIEYQGPPKRPEKV